MDTLSRIQLESKQWERHNFPDQPAWQPLVGMQEELGELSHAFLKKSQNIRLTEDHDKNMINAIGDLLLYICAFCNIVGIDISEALESSWNEVKERDWQKHREEHNQSR